MAKKYVGSVTLSAFMQIIKTELKGKMDVTNIITTLEDYNAETDAEKAVAASLLKSLKEEIDGITVGDGKVSDSDKLDGLDSEDFVQVANVITDWANYDADDETAENKKAVAAALVKVLADKIDAFDADGDGKVDVAANAEQLGGQAPEYYAKAEDLEGVVKVGEDGKVSSDVLPSYVDDVVEGYLVVTTSEEDGSTTATLYEDEEMTTAITPEKGKIYVDLASANGQCYRWSGSTYIEVSSNDMTEISDEEVQALWDTVVAESETEEETEESGETE